MQRAQNGDEWWIKDIASKGYAILSCDLAIATTQSEREAIRRSGARLVGFASAEYDGWAQMRVIIEVYAGATSPKVERL
jgi:hypothetical protein